MEQIMRNAMGNVSFNYMAQEETHLVDNIDSVDWSSHILYSLMILDEDGYVNAVNRYFRDLLQGEGREFEEPEEPEDEDALREELLPIHTAEVVNYYMHDEEKDFKEQADFTNRDAFNTLVDKHILYHLAVLNEDGDLESVNKYFNDLWEENKN